MMSSTFTPEEHSSNFPSVGDFTRRVADAYSNNHLQRGCNRDELVAAFRELGLRISRNQAAQLLCSIREKGSPLPQRTIAADGDQVTKKDSSHQPGLSWADFCVLAVEYHCLSHSESQKEDHDWENSIDGAVQLYLVPMETKKGRTSLHEVFLGGSCNPTTWRKDTAIPVLQDGGITYYNPQVDEWSPDLIEIEEHAKNEAFLLFFVVDNQTRALSSMVEISYLIGCGRRVVIVLNDICGDSPSVAGDPLTAREVEDLNRGRALVRDLAMSHGVICEPTVEEGIKTVVRILNRSISYAELKEKLAHPRTMNGQLGEELRLLKTVFSMYDTEKKGCLTEREACLALRSLHVVSTSSLPPSVSHFLPLPPNTQLLWQRNGLNFTDFSVLYAELRFQELGAGQTGWLYYMLRILASPFRWITDWLWTPPCERNSSFACDVFLGGSCGGTSWRKDISIPILRENGVSYFDPQVSNWTPSLLPIERTAKRESRVRLFVITGSTLSVATLAEAGYYIGKKMKTVLCLFDLPSGTDIAGMRLGDKAWKDYSRSRSYLASIANKSRVPVFKEVAEATQCCVRELRVASHSSLTLHQH